MPDREPMKRKLYPCRVETALPRHVWDDIHSEAKRRNVPLAQVLRELILDELYEPDDDVLAGIQLDNDDG